MRRKPSLLAVGTVAFLVAFLAALPVSSVAPGGKSYAGMLVLIDPDTDEIDAANACVIFTRDTVCTELGDCGSWEMIDRQGRHNEWSMQIEYLNEDGQMVRARGRGLTERGGPGSSIAGILLLELDGIELNAAFAGVRTSRAACLEYGTLDD